MYNLFFSCYLLGRSLYLKAKRIISTIIELNYEKPATYFTAKILTYNIHVHLVFVPKYSIKILRAQIIN